MLFTVNKCFNFFLLLLFKHFFFLNSQQPHLLMVTFWEQFMRKNANKYYYIEKTAANRVTSLNSTNIPRKPNGLWCGVCMNVNSFAEHIYINVACMLPNLGNIRDLLNTNLRVLFSFVLLLFLLKFRKELLKLF